MTPMEPSLNSLKNSRLNQLKTDQFFNHLLNDIKEEPTILAVVVFGSFLYQESYNDVDICLITFSDKIPQEVELKYRVLLPEKYDVRFFSRFPLYIQTEIMEKGVIVFNKEFDALFDIYYEKIKEFSLFSPHFNTYLDAVKDG